jgi:hypothetical protein
MALINLASSPLSRPSNIVAMLRAANLCTGAAAAPRFAICAAPRLSTLRRTDMVQREEWHPSLKSARIWILIGTKSIGALRLGCWRGERWQNRGGGFPKRRSVFAAGQDFNGRDDVLKISNLQKQRQASAQPSAIQAIRILSCGMDASRRCRIPLQSSVSSTCSSVAPPLSFKWRPLNFKWRHSEHLLRHWARTSSCGPDPQTGQSTRYRM